MEKVEPPELLATEVLDLPQGYMTQFEGLVKADLERLVALTHQDPAISRHTPRDLKRRFADVETYHQWRSQHQRFLYPLRDREDVLQGIIWFRQGELTHEGEVYSHTFAIRIYEEARGQGLGQPYMEAALTDMYQRLGEQISGIWLETNINNEPALRLYSKVGFEPLTVDRNADPARVTMGYTRKKLE